MSSLVKVPKTLRFGAEFEFDPDAYQLRRADRVFKLERIPLEILLLLIEERGRLVTREQIAERVWGKDTCQDTDNSINGAIRKIRLALKDDSENPRFVQTVTGKGYRFIAPVEDGEPQPADVAPTPPPTASSFQEEKSARAIGGPWVAALVGALLLLASVGVFWQWSAASPRVSSPHGRTMLAVLPFENLTGDPAQEYFTDGMTEEMIAQLGNTNQQHLGLIARTSVMHYKNSRASLDQIGRELGVQYVIEGSIRRDTDHVRITAQLIQLQDQTHIWARQYDRQLKDLLILQHEIAEEIAAEIQLTLGDQRSVKPASRSAVANTQSYEAHELYLKGLYFWNKRTWSDFDKAAEYFQEAVAKDPNYARAYAGLANTYGLMSTWSEVPADEFMPKARAAALKALSIDSTLPEAHTALGLIAENYDYDWLTAEKEFQRAIELNPDYATAHQWYAEHLAWRGRFNEAFAESERARQLDPLSLIIATDYANLLYYSRQYDRAIAQCRAIRDMDPQFQVIPAKLLFSLVEKGTFSEASDQVPTWRIAPFTASMWAAKAYVDGRWGRRAEAERAYAEFERRFPPGDEPVSRAFRIIAYMGTGRNEQAIALLQRAYSQHSNLVIPIKVDPMYDPLRSDPRFQDLIRKIGLAD